jgi:nucleotide-binding universal stress UspA family protein
MTERILFPTKFEEFSLEILKSICCLKSAGLETVVLLHVIDINNPYKLFAQGETGIVVNLTKIQEEATDRLSSYAEYLASNGVEAKIAVAAGPLVSEIIRIAQEERASLIVTGRQQRSLLGDLFIGSTTDRIINESPLPVLVMGHQVSNEIRGEAIEQVCHRMFRKVLFALDWSPETDRASEYLQAFRQMESSEVIIVHVVGNGFPKSHSMTADSQETNEMRKEELESFTQELRENGFNSRAYLIHGDKPYEEINRIATEENVTIIIMGSQGKRLVQRIIRGSVSQRVLEDSEKPVLVVR